jgi:GTP-binding protein Era
MMTNFVDKIDSGSGEHRSGYVALVGQPNAGKSTLMNALLGTHLAITSARAQTTRNRITGILSGSNYQAILVDTPGLLRPRDPLQKVMMQTTEAVLRDADVVVFLMEVVGKRSVLPKAVLGLLRTFSGPVILALNKVDRVQKPTLLPLIERVQAELDWREIVPISALKRDGLEPLSAAFGQLLPLGPKLFPDDELSEEPTRFFVAEFIREQLVRLLNQELPYAVAVGIDLFKRDSDLRKRYIEATVVVERDSQKGIVIGRQGDMIKRIGSRARSTIEAFLGEPVFLTLRVAVDRRWTGDPVKLARLGYRPVRSDKNR